ncbi:EF-hand domain-containing protein [Nitrospirillum iridis]|uniref:NADH dehydrogenase/NADH:ubiquinone oxidoreductase subunit G n=1 Tax=Nitrospirillum iridis TaxID=765888 RepID=A0A7X0AW75_9PROT|nr:EF-hand domain-containing protein [Nitrospirillum iridis]MBB6249786.1 NADH dehydrogenase/NADH:ubiquinone oxidoreductase subunit G [Nitrospirillum iridis]
MALTRSPARLAASTLACAALLAAGVARGASHDVATFIREHDQNGDGVVTAQEYQAVRDNQFKALDTNGDGWVSEAEYTAEFEARLAKENVPADRKAQQLKQTHIRFVAIDLDGDQKMSREEFMASGWRMFGYHDKNGDQKVDQADVDLAAAFKPLLDKARGDKAP